MWRTPIQYSGGQSRHDAKTKQDTGLISNEDAFYETVLYKAKYCFECQLKFNFKIPSEQLAQRIDNFIRRLHCVWYVWSGHFVNTLFLCPVNKDVYNAGNRLRWVEWSRDRWRHAALCHHSDDIMPRARILRRLPACSCLSCQLKNLSEPELEAKDMCRQRHWCVSARDH